MADLSRLEMIDRVLRRISVLGAGQNAPASQVAIVGPVLDSTHAGLRGRNMAPFPTSAFPDWAQEAFAQILTFFVGPYFGIKVSETEKDTGEYELVRQLRTHNQGNPIKAKYY